MLGMAYSRAPKGSAWADHLDNWFLDTPKHIHTLCDSSRVVNLTPLLYTIFETPGHKGRAVLAQEISWRVLGIAQPPRGTVTDFVIPTSELGEDLVDITEQGSTTSSRTAS